MKTTKKQFNFFRDECLRLIDLLGLKDYAVTFHHIKLEKNTRAEIIFNVPNKVASINFSTDSWDKVFTDDDIKQSAKHEIAHLLTAELEHIGLCRYINDGEMDIAMETFARRFEKLDI